MRVAILTLPLHTNYGGILQAYALQTVLQRMGHEAEVLDKCQYSHLPIYQKPFVYACRAFQKYILNKNIAIQKEKMHNARLDKERPLTQFTCQFVNKHVNIRKINAFEEIKEGEYDAIVVGSDQIWRRKYINDTLYAPVTDAFLGFAKKWEFVRVSYAASFGSDNWEFSAKETKSIADLLQKFDAVSVREETAVKLCEDKLGIKAKRLLDPTLLLSSTDYDTLLQYSKERYEDKLLMVYILDRSQEKDTFVKKVAEDYALVPHYVGADVENRALPVEQRIQPPVEEWIRGIRNSEMVVTDSFHACVFAIIYQKPFIVIGNEERGMARLESFLKLLNMQTHLLYKLSDYNKDEDYSISEMSWSILEREKSISMHFLEESLSINE